MVQALREVKALGVNGVPIHPYGGISLDGEVSLGRLESETTPPIWLERPSAKPTPLV